MPLLPSHFSGVQSLVPVLIQHVLVITCFTEDIVTALVLSCRVRLSELSPQRAEHHNVLPSSAVCGLTDVEGFVQKCVRQGMQQEH